MGQVFAIASEALTVRVAALGAEMLAITDASGAEWMTDADPAFWTGHAPILFPIVGEVAGGAIRLDGREFRLERHGFARQREFAVVDQAADAITLRLTDDAATRAVYPFAFQLDLAFRVAGAVVTMTATVRNTGVAALPFSLGFHPAFAWPLPGGGAKTAHRIAFDKREPGPIRRLDRDGLLRAYEDTNVGEDGVLALRPVLFEADAMIWDQLASRALTYEGAGSETATAPAIDVAFADCPMLGLWQKPGADFLCIEPWAGIADPAGFDGDFRAKPGVLELPPGEARAFTVDLTIRSAAPIEGD